MPTTLFDKIWDAHLEARRAYGRRARAHSIRPESGLDAVA